MSWKKISLVFLLLIILVYTYFPFYWAIVSALKKAGTGTFIVKKILAGMESQIEEDGYFKIKKVI